VNPTKAFRSPETAFWESINHSIVGFYKTIPNNKPTEEKMGQFFTTAHTPKSPLERGLINCAILHQISPNHSSLHYTPLNPLSRGDFLIARYCIQPTDWRYFTTAHTPKSPLERGLLMFCILGFDYNKKDHLFRS